MKIHFYYGERGSEEWRSMLETCTNPDNLNDEETADFETGGICHVEFDVENDTITMYTGDGHWYITMSLKEMLAIFGTVEIIKA